jgi:hypothetical protein
MLVGDTVTDAAACCFGLRGSDVRGRSVDVGDGSRAGEDQLVVDRPDAATDVEYRLARDAVRQQRGEELALVDPEAMPMIGGEVVVDIANPDAALQVRGAAPVVRRYAL